MSTSNKKGTVANPTTHSQSATTFEGGEAEKEGYAQQLERSVMSCLLWEKTFYEDGVSISDRIRGLLTKVSSAQAIEIAMRAKHDMYLRHVPLFILAELFKIYDGKPEHFHPKMRVSAVYDLITRVDDMGELISLYWDGKKKPLPNALKKGLAMCFNKFDEYQLAKYNRSSAAITPRDVMFMVHPRPKDAEQEALFAKLANQELATPDTWEVHVSAAGKDIDKKKAAYEGLLREGKMGALAFLRNMRNMIDCNVDDAFIREFLNTSKFSRIMPFQFLNAATYAPKWAEQLHSAMFKGLDSMPKLPGKTLIMIDLSGSMSSPISNGVTRRADVAAAVGVIGDVICESSVVYGYNNDLISMGERKGLSLWGSLKSVSGGTKTWDCTAKAVAMNKDYNRIIIITDEQTSDNIKSVELNPRGKHYIINVAPYGSGMNSIDNKSTWVRINGWSEKLFTYIYKMEGFGTISEE